MKSYLETWETEPRPGGAPALPAAVDHDRRLLPILDAQGNHIPDKRPRCGFGAHLHAVDGRMRR
jgi:hypothetical protein